MGLMAGGVYRRQVAGRMRAISGSDLGKSLKSSVITGGVVKRNFARAALGVLDAGAKAKVGGAKTFDDQVKERQEELNKYLSGEHYSGKSIATVLNKGVTGNDVDKKAADNIHHDLKTEQHAEAYAFGGLDAKTKEKYYDDHGVGKMTLDTRAAVANKIKDGLPSHKKEFFDDKGAPLATFNQAKWEGMSDNQRRYVLENLTEDEAKKLDSVDNTLEKMLRVMMKKDKSGVENIAKSGKTDNLVKKIMGQSTVDIAIKSNLYDAYKAAEKNNPAEATRIAKHFEDHTGGEDVKKYEMNKDFDNERRTAEFYNKSLHRYVDFDPVADKKRKARLKVAVEVSKTAGETKEELKEDRVADKTGKAFAKYMKTP